MALDVRGARFLSKTDFSIEHLDSVDSTNRYLKSKLIARTKPTNTSNALTSGIPLDELLPEACVANHQTQGYGQQGRGWVTNAESAIASMTWPLPKGSPFLPASSLKIAMALHRVLSEQVHNALYVKWPNDVYTSTGKAGGLLIEQQTLEHQRVLILGVGINRSPITLPENLKEGLSTKPAAPVSYVDRFDLDDLLYAWAEALKSVDMSTPLSSCEQEYWQSNDWFHVNENVQLIEPNAVTRVHYLGVDTQGQAWVESQGARRALTSGLSSLRKL